MECNLDLVIPLIKYNLKNNLNSNSIQYSLNYYYDLKLKLPTIYIKYSLLTHRVIDQSIYTILLSIMSN